jgi:hypothetical protein
MLQTLDLSWCGLSSKNLLSIAESLLINANRLKNLNLSYNFMTDEEVSNHF